MSIECKDCKLTRRAFLKRAGVGAGALLAADPLLRNVAATFGQSSGGTGNLLVLCQLAGGLDALSFLAPYQHSVYRNRRPQLALAAADVTPLPDNATYGINNQFSFFSELYAQGQLAIVQQVGYPNENGSHFESQEIYEYGVRNLRSSVGASATWYERLRRTYFDEPFGVLDTQRIGDPTRFGYPDTTFRQAARDAFGRLARMKEGRTPRQQATLDAYDHIDVIGADLRAKTEGFQSSGQARGEFYRAAALASAKLSTQIIKLTYGGFDTHGSQIEANAQLFPRVNNDFRQFVDDLKNYNLWDRACILFYTEFGRRNEENGSPGTDHGHGCHMMLAGPGVNGGLHGQNVSTGDMNRDNLPYYVDFRAPFSAAIRDWLGFDPRPIFQIDGETYDETVGSALFS